MFSIYNNTVLNTFSINNGNITGLFNYSSGDLNGQLTANSSLFPLNCFTIVNYAGSGAHLWQLQTGISGIQTPYFLVPIDYNGASNQKVWVMVL